MLTEARPAHGSPDRLRVRAASHSRIESGEQARAPRALLPTASETPASESRGPTKWARAVLENDPERRNRSCRLDQRSHPRSPLHTESVTHFHSSPRCFLRETPPKERKRKQARSPRARDERGVGGEAYAGAQAPGETPAPQTVHGPPGPLWPSTSHRGHLVGARSALLTVPCSPATGTTGRSPGLLAGGSRTHRVPAAMGQEPGRPSRRSRGSSGLICTEQISALTREFPSFS